MNPLTDRFSQTCPARILRFGSSHSLSGLFCLFSGLTLWLLSGILSLPWSPLASLPPDVDVPLPLGLAFMELPTVGDVPGVAELAAGSPMTEPRPLGPPLFEPAWFGPACANARVLESASMLASAIDESFMIGFLVQLFIRKQTAAALDVPTISGALEASTKPDSYRSGTFASDHAAELISALR